jgi:hypothetical protein
LNEAVAWRAITAGRASAVEEAVFELLLRWVLDRALMAAPDGERKNRRCTVARLIINNNLDNNK